MKDKKRKPPKRQVTVVWLVDTGPCDLDNEFDRAHNANENGCSITIGEKAIFLCDRHARQVLTGLRRVYPK